VLLALRPALSPGPRVILTPRDTWLATLSINGTPERMEGIQGVIQKHIGLTGTAPTQALSDGTTVTVLRMTGPTPFESVSTDFSLRPDAVRISSTGFLALGAGKWLGSSLLTVPRDQLPVMDRDRAKALVEELDAFLYRSRPASPPKLPTRRVRPVPPMHKVTWDDEEAIERLEKNGYGVAPAPSGHVGLRTGSRERAVAVVHVSSKVPQVLELVATKYGTAPCRVASDGSRAYIFQADEPFQTLELARMATSDSGALVPGTYTRIHVEASKNVVALSGADEAGKSYRWEGSLLETKRHELPHFSQGMAQMLLTDVVRLLNAVSTDCAA
jgi:hypothetical protein